MSEEDRLPTPDEEVGPYRSSGRPDSMHLGLHELSMTSIDARDSLEMLSVPRIALTTDDIDFARWCA